MRAGRGLIVLILQVQLAAFGRIHLPGALGPQVGCAHPAHFGQQPKAEQRHDNYRRNGVEGERDDVVKRLDGAAVAKLRHTLLGKKQAGEKHRPGRKRQDGAHGRAGGIYHIRKSLARHFIAVCLLFHAGAQRHDIEVIVHKNQNAHHPCDKQGRARPPGQ